MPEPSFGNAEVDELRLAGHAGVVQDEQHVVPWKGEPRGCRRHDRQPPILALVERQLDIPVPPVPFVGLGARHDEHDRADPSGRPETCRSKVLP